MPWDSVFVALVVSHLIGDCVLQTDWQATHKGGGLGRDPVARRAQLMHVATSTPAFVPALAWAAKDLATSLVGGVLLAVPHVVQDDGRLRTLSVRKVKGCDPPEPRVVGAVDQSLHIAALFALALVLAT